jgi:hypothetical protein
MLFQRVQVERQAWLPEGVSERLLPKSSAAELEAGATSATSKAPPTNAVTSFLIL